MRFYLVCASLVGIWAIPSTFCEELVHECIMILDAQDDECKGRIPLPWTREEATTRAQAVVERCARPGGVHRAQRFREDMELMLQRTCVEDNPPQRPVASDASSV